LVDQLRKRSTKNKEYSFAIISLVASSIVAFVVSLPAFFNVGFSFGIIIISLWVYFVWRTKPNLKLLKTTEEHNFNPTPLYLICIPIVALAARLVLIKPATAFSRNHAIHHGAELINDIEAYYDANGYYPISPASVWKDYSPSVIGVEQYYYEPSGDAYNIFFEQFTFQLDMREIVVYKKFDEQVIIGHDSWILLLPPGELEHTRGYYDVYDASAPHWKYFWFG